MKGEDYLARKFRFLEWKQDSKLQMETLADIWAVLAFCF